MIPIRRVTVHRDGAIVERQGKACVAQGRVIVGGLPLTLEARSLRVRIEGALVQRVRLALEVPEISEPAPPPADTRGEIEAELRRVEAEIAALQVERQAAVQLAPGWDPEGGLPSPERVTRWAELEAAVGPWVERVDFALRDARSRREELTARANELPLAAEPTEGSDWAAWSPTQQAIIEVEGEGEVEVVVSYRVEGARWSPGYQLDADAMLTSGRLVLRASVSQATGEDWTGVDLRLSSRASSRSVALPPLLAFRMGAPPPVPPRSWRSAAADFEALLGRESSSDAPAAGVAIWSEDSDLATDDSLVGDESWEVEGLVEDQIVEIAAAGQEDDIDPERRFEIPEIREVPAASGADDGQDTAITGLAEVTPSGHEVAAPTVPDPVEPVIQVPDPLLEFEHITLGGLAGPESDKGRLVFKRDRLPPELPPPGRARLAAWLADAERKQGELSERPLPAHHASPAPAMGVDVEHEAQGQVDLPSDGESRWVAVFSEPLEIEVRYTAVPRNELRAYRRVQATLSRTAPLLPGPFQVFVGGDLETTVAWDGVGAGTGLDLSLGVEDRITVARNVKYREERLEAQNGARRFHTTVDVRVTSELPREVSVQLIERVPVPDEGDGPEVEITTSTPIAKPYMGSAYADLDGARVQTLEVPPNGEARAVLGYVIGLRAEQEMTGEDQQHG